jgi:mycothiol synthase
MESRPATPDDVPAIADLERRWETRWYGAPELSESEVRESYERAQSSRLLIDDGRIVAAAWVWQSSTVMVVDPDAAVAPIYADLLPWFAGHPGVEVEAISRDDVLQSALTDYGWRHVNSSFELVRAVTPDWEIAEPVWPEGIEVRGAGADDALAMHQLIYVDAGWAEVRGHPDREFEEWRGVFATKHELPEQQVLAWRGERLVGVAIGRMFSDGTGWVAQLAVAKDERGQGLGRALLLEALRRRRAAGATSVGLGVQHENRGALTLYLDVGLTIDREWMQYTLPA